MRKGFYILEFVVKPIDAEPEKAVFTDDTYPAWYICNNEILQGVFVLENEDTGTFTANNGSRVSLKKDNVNLFFNKAVAKAALERRNK